MKITAVNMRLVDREKVKAFASITIDDEFVVHDLRIVQGEKGLFVAMPSRRLPNGEFRDVAHPIKSEIREMVQNAVLEEYERQLEAAPQAAEALAEAPAAPAAMVEEKPATELAGKPAEEAPAEEAPAEEAPGETAAEEAPAETPAEEKPAEEAPAEESGATMTPEEEAPAAETPTPEQPPIGEEPEEVSEEKAREEVPEDPSSDEAPQQ